jgi:transketolase
MTNLRANALRMLAVDAVQAANSGHPGMPMGMADIAEVLWNQHLSHNPGDPAWTNRDRFVLSNGHGSALLYALLHLSGYDLPIDELKRFRQLHSKTPGHPEYGLTPGVETTTGPLGQGLANAVGMALGERLLAQEFNTAEHAIVDHYTYAFCGDGCLMEGVSHEACSLAGTWQLNKLVVFWDDNGISIDGHVEGWFSDDTPKRFEAYGWQVIRGVDGHDATAIDAAIRQAKSCASMPTLICCKTTIGMGSPNKAGTHDVHGAPLGLAEIAAVRQLLDWPHEPFVIPEAVASQWDARGRGQALQSRWTETFDAWRARHPEQALEFERRTQGQLPAGFENHCTQMLANWSKREGAVATRKASQEAITELAACLPEFLGGSADLSPSNLTNWPGCQSVSGQGGGNYIHYGVREFGMSAIMNGLFLHGGYRPFGGTFLMFSEYARNALRMSALMRIAPIFVFTHDSIGLGEDGPTHQPVEQISTLRLMPNMDLWRPCDALETAVAWQQAVRQSTTPTCLALSRQNLPMQPRDDATIQAVVKGGYVLVCEAAGRAPDVVLIATGSEVQLAVAAAGRLAGQGIAARVVSMPSVHQFLKQDAAWREQVLPHGVPRVAVEAGATMLWRAFVGLDGAVVGIDTFGESGPANELAEHFGITVETVVKEALGILS